MKPNSDHSRARPSIARPAFRSAAGFTMVEIALCLAIIGFALVAIVGVLPTGLQAQKDNRDDTVINQEGTYFLEAIRSGSLGLHDLPNRVDWIQITNLAAAPTPIDRTSFRNGADVIGLLSTPKHTNYVERDYVTVLAKVHPATGSAAEQNPAMRGFTFSYLLQSEIVPFTAPQVLYGNNRAAMAMSTNCYELKLTLRWPLLPNNSVGSGKQVFRTLISGRLICTNFLNYNDAGTTRKMPLYSFQPSIYGK